MSEKPWWFPEIIDDDYFNRLRKDYPDRAILSDDELRYEFGVGNRKYAITWDHVGDAYEQFEKLADAYIDLMQLAERS